MPIFDEGSYNENFDSGKRGYNNAKPIEYEVSESGCWECTSHYPVNGYPRFKRNRVSYNISNYVYELANKKKMEEGNFILHACDNPLCINPEHLSEGTQKENMDDMTKKGRRVTKVGSKRSTAILNEEDARQIKIMLKEGKKVADISREYSVHCNTISNIKVGRNWKHVRI